MLRTISSLVPTTITFATFRWGGLDEVGMNCAIVECNGSMLMVDCGYTFPEGDAYGVDYVLPDWSYVTDNLDRLDGVLITHGHQDHIGALPYFLREVDVPVYSGDLTLTMIEDQLAQNDLADEVDLYPIDTSEILEIGPFWVEFVHVNHSVPNARSISLETPVGRFVITGDWKLDQTAMYEPVMDLQTFAEFGRDGTVAVFGDSTNAQVDGFSTSEHEVYQNVKSVAKDAPGRVIVAQFSSNVHRLHSMVELAAEQNRKVLLLGRSIRDNFQLARESGHLELSDPDIMIKPHELGQLPDERILILSTGSQAEPRASLSRMSHGDHHHVTLRDTDTVVISARAIPGNKRGIQSMIDDLTRRGANVVEAADAPIHGSGHACAEELKLMANLTDPEYLVPVHGHYRMRKEHAKLGEQVGVPEQELIENGDVLQFTRDDTRVVGEVETGRVIVDGAHVWDLEEIELRNRAKLAESGLVVAHAVVDRSTGELTAPPELVQRGFLDDEPDLLDEAVKSIQHAIEALSNEARRDVSEVEGAVRRSIRQFFRERIERQPVVIPVVHEV